MENVQLTPLSRVPDRVVAGDSIIIRAVALMAAYDDAEDYAVSWLFAPAAGGAVTIVPATAADDAWNLLVAASATENWAPGRWRWSVRVTNGDFAQTIDQGLFSVMANPSSANADSRTQAQRILDLVTAAIEGRASATDLEYEFEDGRRLRRMTHAEMLVLRDRYAKIVRSEQRKAKGSGAGRVLVSL